MNRTVLSRVSAAALSLALLAGCDAVHSTNQVVLDSGRVVSVKATQHTGLTAEGKDTVVVAADELSLTVTPNQLTMAGKVLATIPTDHMIVNLSLEGTTLTIETAGTAEEKAVVQTVTIPEAPR